MSSVRDLFVGIRFQDEASAVIKKVDKSVDNVESKVVGLGRELDDAEYGFISLGKTGIRASDKIGDSLDDAGDEASELNKRIKNIESSLSGLKRAAVGLGSVIAGAFAIDKIKDFSISAVEAAASTQALNSQFSQVFGDLEQKATANMNKIAQEAGMLPSRLQGSFTQIAAFAKTTGMDTSDALSLTERAMRVAADSAAFYDRSIEEVTENLQSFLKGNYENDAALGISATETTRNAAAMKLYGKEFNKLTEMQKQFTLLSMVEEGNKLSGALGQAARESDTFENQLGNLKQAWADFKSVIGGPLLEPVVSGMKDVTEWLQNLDTEKIANGIQRAAEFGATLKDTVFSIIYNTGEVSDLWQNFGLSKEASDTIEGIGEVLRTAVVGGVELAKTAFDGLKIGIQWLVEHKDAVISVGGGLATGFAAFKTLSFVGGVVKNVSDGVKNFVGIAKNAGGVMKTLGVLFRANPFGMIATGIGLAITAGIYLWRNWDTIKEKASDLWNKTKEVFGLIPEYAKTKFGELKQWVSNSVDEAKNKVVWVFTEMPFVVAEKLGFMVGASISIISQLPSKISELLGLAKEWGVQKVSELKTEVVQWFTTAKDEAIGIVTELPSKIAGIIGEIPGAIGGVISSVYSKFKELGASIPKAISEGFTAAFEGLGKGVKWAFNKMVEGVSNLKELGAGLAASFNEGVKKGGGISLDGSHATGLAKVPFDGYRAELHKGEAVLTAQQSNALRAAGILREKGDGTPELRIDSPQQSANTNNYNSSSSLDINVPINVVINGQTVDTGKIAKTLKSVLPLEVRKIIENILIGEIEAMEG